MSTSCPTCLLLRGWCLLSLLELVEDRGIASSVPIDTVLMDGYTHHMQAAGPSSYVEVVGFEGDASLQVAVVPASRPAGGEAEGGESSSKGWCCTQAEATAGKCSSGSRRAPKDGVAFSVAEIKERKSVGRRIADT